MTPQQKTAIASPCLLHHETVRPRFLWGPQGGWSLVLTVNSGYE